MTFNRGMQPTPPSVPFDFQALLFSILFIALGILLGVMWPRSIRKQIDEGEADANMGSLIWMLRFIGMGMILYCLGDIIFRIGRAVKLW